MPFYVYYVAPGALLRGRRALRHRHPQAADTLTNLGSSGIDTAKLPCGPAHRVFSRNLLHDARRTGAVAKELLR